MFANTLAVCLYDNIVNCNWLETNVNIFIIACQKCLKSKCYIIAIMLIFVQILHLFKNEKLN